jgi:hypothetical protein
VNSAASLEARSSLRAGGRFWLLPRWVRVAEHYYSYHYYYCLPKGELK